MSHFVVFVIGEDIEKALAPYQENNMGSCPKEFLKWYSVEEESRKDYENDSKSMVKFQGEIIHKYDDRFENPKYDGFNQKYVYPDGSEFIEVPVKECYSYDEYMGEYCGYRKDPDKKEYGYWENPNKKWDWWELGGRWTGYLKLKEGSSGQKGRPGLMTSEAQEGYADRAFKKDVDWLGMREKAKREGIKRYEDFHNILDGRRLYSWDSIKKRHEDINSARAEYNAQEPLKDLGAYWDVDPYLLPMEKFLEHHINQNTIPFALVYNGKWIEKGSMGWWGIVSDEEKEWPSMFNKAWSFIPSDEIVNVIDCHI